MRRYACDSCTYPLAESREASVVREFFATNLWHRMAPHQTAMVVPGLFADTNTSRSGSLASQDERALSKLR
eukprot:COSAG01_NODE_68447_length_264_cov_0.624242_1_plen_70_part_10